MILLSLFLEHDISTAIWFFSFLYGMVYICDIKWRRYCSVVGSRSIRHRNCHLQAQTPVDSKQRTHANSNEFEHWSLAIANAKQSYREIFTIYYTLACRLEWIYHTDISFVQKYCRLLCVFAIHMQWVWYMCERKQNVFSPIKIDVVAVNLLNIQYTIDIYAHQTLSLSLSLSLSPRKSSNIHKCLFLLFG